MSTSTTSPFPSCSDVRGAVGWMMSPSHSRIQHSSVQKMEPIFSLRDLLEIELIAHLLVATVCCADVATVWCADKKAEYPFARLQFLASVSGDLPPHIQDGESVSGDDEEYADMPDLVYATDMKKKTMTICRS